MKRDETTLSAAIADIYDAALDPAKWAAALASACAYVGGQQAMMFWQDAASDGVETVHRHNDDPHFSRLYVERYAPLNPVFPAAFFQEVGSVTAGSDLVPHPEMRETRFFREWLAPQGLTESLATILEKEAARAAFFAVQWQGRAMPEAARARMALLVPHLQRAVAIGRLFVRHEADAAAMTRTLDHVGEAVFLLAGDGRVVFVNARGRAMIDEGALLHLRGERLRPVAAEADRLLQHGLHAAEAGAPAGGGGTSFALEEGPDERWIAHLLPLADGARRQVGHAHRAGAALFVRRSRFADPTPLETLAKTCALTASEIRVVEASLRVSGLDAVADALGIAKATVKTHLNRVYRKCAVKNQSELIKRVAGLGRH